MNATKRIATLTLGLGILSACGTAFAHGTGHAPGAPVNHTPTPGFYGYDTNFDRRVSLQEFQQRELIRCENDFRQNDRNQDGVVSDHEWRESSAIHCEAWRAAFNWDNANDSWSVRPSLYPTRVGYDQVERYQRPRVVRSYDSGITWSEMRRVSFEQSARIFHDFDRDCDGSLNKAELRSFIESDDDSPAPRPIYRRPLAFYRAR
jgi:hypothetical protein